MSKQRTSVRVLRDLTVNDTKTVTPASAVNETVVKRGAEISVTWTDDDLFILQALGAIDIIADTAGESMNTTIDDEVNDNGIS